MGGAVRCGGGGGGTVVIRVCGVAWRGVVMLVVAGGSSGCGCLGLWWW